MIAEQTTHQAIEREVVRFVLEQLRETGERRRCRVFRDALHHVRSRFPGSPPPARSRRWLTENAIRDAVAVGLLVERWCRTCDWRTGDADYGLFLAVANGQRSGRRE